MPLDAPPASGKEMTGFLHDVWTRWANLRAREIFQECMSASNAGALSHSAWMVEGLNKRAVRDEAIFLYKDLSHVMLQILEDSYRGSHEWLEIFEDELRKKGLKVFRKSEYCIVFEENRPWKKNIQGQGLNFELSLHWGAYDVPAMKSIGKY